MPKRKPRRTSSQIAPGRHGPAPKRYRAFAQYYDAEYDGAEMLQRDVPFFLEHLPRRSQQVLELAVGTGRAAIPITQAGHRVVGVDNDSAMLELATFKRDSVGISPKQLQFIRQDALHLKLSRTFDWVCIFFNTFLNFVTLEEQDRLLQGVRTHLRPRGRAWIDIFNPNLELLARPHSEHLDPATFYVPALDRSIHRDTEIHSDTARQIQHITFHYRWHDEQAVARHERLEFDLTFLFPRELQILLERNGLRLLELYGDYDGSDVTTDSPRLIALCRRN